MKTQKKQIKEKINNKHLNIENPQRNLRRVLIFIVGLFVFLGYKSYVSFDINSFNGMIIMLSLLIIPTLSFFIWTTSKNIKALDEAINNGEMIVYWKYSKKEWQNYLNYEMDYRTNEGIAIAIFLSIMTAIIFIPFAIIVQEIFMIYVMLALFVMYGFMGFILPKIMYFIRKRKQGKVILLENGLLLGKQFHTWNFPLSKFSHANYKKTPYEHLEVVYKFVDRTGPRIYTVNVPIPKTNKKDIKEIISKFK